MKMNLEPPYVLNPGTIYERTTKPPTIELRKAGDKLRLIIRDREGIPTGADLDVDTVAVLTAHFIRYRDRMMR